MQIEVLRSFKTPGTAYPVAQRHIPKYLEFLILHTYLYLKNKTQNMLSVEEEAAFSYEMSVSLE
jgi:hypothetical protein